MTCGCAETGKVDHLRGLTVAKSGIGAASPQEAEVDLCQGARVYSFTLEGFAAAVIPLGELIATLKLQDSEFDLVSDGTAKARLHADLPGLAFPAFARLIVQRDRFAVLHLSYGDCA